MTGGDVSVTATVNEQLALFWRSSVATQLTVVRPAGNSVPDGGVCDPNAWGNEDACYQFVGKPFEAKAEWQEIVVRFDELKLLNHPDRHRTLDSSAIYDILFNFYHHDGSAFQLMVDDLAFMRETAAGCR